MPTETIYTRATPDQVRRILAGLPDALRGAGPQGVAIGQGMQLRLGTVLLTLIKANCIDKARGGGGADGERWAPLSPRTIAYGRRHPGLEEIRRRAREQGRQARPLLTDEQEALWWQVYRRTIAGQLRGRKGPADRAQKARAAAAAWAAVKRAGGRTILGTYGNVQVEIGRDTGVMLNSLSPGVDGPSGDPNQVFRLEPGAVVVGTNVPYAKYFHRRRRLWPDPETGWPDAWHATLGQAAATGAVTALRLLLSGGLSP